MILTVSAYKGGVAKTTTALHVAGVLGLEAPTLLVDRDRMAGAVRWYRKGDGWPFDAIEAKDVTTEQLRDYRARGHLVFDTPAAPTSEELVAFGQRSDLVLIPTTPDALAIEALVHTVKDLRHEGVPFRVVLTIVPPFPSVSGARARAALERAGLPVLKRYIPRAAAFHHAALQGVLVEDVRDRRAASLGRAYEEVTREVRAAIGANP